MRPRRIIDNSTLTTNERTTLILSVIAIAFSVIQMIFSIPIFSDHFYSPEIVCALEKKEYINGSLDFYFKVSNDGNKPAENLAISLTCYSNDKITVAPNLDILVEEKENGIPLKDIIIKSESFIPGDYIYIIVQTDSAHYKTRNLSPVIPFIGQIKHKQGFGRSH